MAENSTANNTFGLHLFRIISEGDPKSNGFISPYSMSVALSMTKLGAGQDTASGMAEALKWGGMDENAVHEGNMRYINLLGKPVDGCALSTANRLYIERQFSVLPEFLQKTQEFYLAQAVSCDFTKNAERERVGINTWVAQQTNDKIKDLLAKGSVGSATRMVLVNAIYFKGLWASPFEKSSTRKKPFKVSASVTKDVSTMFASEKSLRFLMDDGQSGFSALELPYKGNDLSMVILLPTEDFGLSEMEKSLTQDKLSSIFSKLSATRPRDIDVSLPKFEMTCSYGMKTPLSQMGMGTAFDPSKADFSKMTDCPDIVLSDVVHKAFIKVDEEGTEAAAATAVMMALSCVLEPMQFIVDHPFYFVIRDKRVSNCVLFMGRVTDPSI